MRTAVKVFIIAFIVSVSASVFYLYFHQVNIAGETKDCQNIKNRLAGNASYFNSSDFADYNANCADLSGELAQPGR